MTAIASVTPPAPATRLHGSLELDFQASCEQGRTILDARAQPPLKVVRAFKMDDGAALVHLHNISGGVLGGDLLETDITLGPQARAQLTTTGATRLYRTRPDALPATQRYTVTVGPDALLEYLPDALIPFAGSRYRQETRITLQTGAGLFWWETVASGREARGERFEYADLKMTLNLDAERPLARERVHLQPNTRPPTDLARLGPFGAYSTFYICRVGLEASRWLALESQLTALARQMTIPTEVIWGVSALPAHGLAVRGVSRTTRLLSDGLPAFWRAAKQELYREAAIPPRKVY